MANITAGVLIRLKDQFSAGIDKASNKVSDFQNKMQGAFSKIDGVLNSTASNLATLGVSIGIGATVNKMIAFEDRMNKLGTVARMNAKDIETAEKQMNGLSEAIYKAAMQPDVKIDANEILDAMDEIMEKTGDMDFAVNNIDNIARAVRGFNATGKDMGGLMAEFNKLGLTAEETAITLDKLYLQGNIGAFAAKDFAALGSTIMAAYSMIGSSADDIVDAGAAMQVLRQSVGSSEEAVTKLEGALSELADPEVRKALEELGWTIGEDFSTMNADGSMKDFNTIMMQIVEAEKKLGTGWGKIREAKIIGSDMFYEALNAYKNYGNSLEDYLDLEDAAGKTQEAAAMNAQSLKANLQNLQTAFDGFANKNLAPKLQQVTDILNKFAENPERFEAVFKVLAAGFGIFMTAKLVNGVYNTINSLRGLKNIRSGGGVISQTLTSTGSSQAIPVYVTNFAQFSSGGGTVGNSMQYNIPNVRGGKGAMLRGALKTAGGNAAMGAALALPTVVSDFVNISNNDQLSDKEKNRAKGESVGGAVGSVAGMALGGMAGAATTAAIGAAVGSVIPGLGTAIGGIVGLGIGALGGVLGQKLGSKIGESLTKEDTLEKTITANNIQNNNAQVEMKGAANIGVDIKLTDERTYYKATPYNNNIPNINIQTGNINEIRNMAY
ncbi:phage tail tape measure protein [Brachyspira murdochii]|uniref:phage tail tape measure protein n=1 Tax=Brachyspira murdochii TaxID=84378 RepID=UPI0012F496D2|nr:phage tail tape measure protein [Brachyspira murdochii]